MSNTTYDSYREDVAGRANVEDTPELLAYYRELERLETGALWTVANEIEPWQPESASVPMIWRYGDLREQVLRSVELVTPEKAGRRVVYLSNPGRREVSAAVGWLYSGLQVMHPGEVPRRTRIRPRRCASSWRAPAPTRSSTATRSPSAPTTSCSRPTAPGTSTASTTTARPASGRTGSTSRWSTPSRPTSMPSIPTCSRRSAIRSTTCTAHLGRPRPAPAAEWSSPIRRCCKYGWDRPMKPARATPRPPTARPSTA